MFIFRLVSQQSAVPSKYAGTHQTSTVEALSQMGNENVEELEKLGISNYAI